MQKKFTLQHQKDGLNADSWYLVGRYLLGTVPTDNQQELNNYYL